MRLSSLRLCTTIIISLFLCVSCSPNPSAIATATSPSIHQQPVVQANLRIPERVATTPFPTLVASRNLPSDFALIFGYGACGITRRLDTVTGTLTQFPRTTAPITIPLTLTSVEIEQIYQKLISISFFSYPERFTTNLPDTILVESASEHPSYEFVMRADNRTKQVWFDDSIFRPTTTEVENLREAVTLIRTIVSEQEELKQLPPLEETCP